MDEHSRLKGEQARRHGRGAPGPDDEARYSQDGTGAGVNYDDSRGEQRYVGGGRRGGQNWANDGYGGSQSYSAGTGYRAAQGGDSRFGNDQRSSRHGAQERDYSVSPRDLGVQDFDLQGSYGQPAYGQNVRHPMPKSYQRSDERICEDIYERIIARSHIDARDVTVEVKEGLVTLTGQVPDRRMKHEIEDIADGCSGAKEVENRLRVAQP